MDLGRSLPQHRRQTDSYRAALDLSSCEPGFGLLPLRAAATDHRNRAMTGADQVAAAAAAAIQRS